VTYTYLVNAHWSPEAQYTFVNLFDPEVAIDWPILKDHAIISEKDAGHPFLRDVTPMEV
jgi:dTDP-4-dehydrorhamnose 3,5-epimerase